MLSVWQRNIVDRFGNVVPNATVEVRDTGTGELSEIYSDSEGTTPLDNPFTADASGFAKFYARGGLYNITVHAGGAPFTWDAVALGALSRKDEITADVITDDADELAAIRSKLGVTAAADALAKDNNLSDLSSALLARQNLGLGTAATYDYSDFDEAGSAALVADSLEDLEGSLGELAVKDTVSEAIGDADAVNVNARLGVFNSVADVEGRNIPPVLDSIRTNGYYDPGDGGGALYKRVAVEPSHAGKIQSADGQWWEDVGYNTITVRIPSDFPTLQAAIEHYSRLPLRAGAIIDLLIESGHRLTHGLRLVDGGSYRKFRISAEDAVVELDPNFEPVDSSPVAESNWAVFYFEGVQAPVINCIIHGGSTANQDGLVGYQGAVLRVNVGCGLTGHRANLMARAATVFARGSIWNDAQRQCAVFTEGSRASFHVCELNDGWKSWTEGVDGASDCALHISRGSIVAAPGCQIHRSGRGAITVRRSFAYLENSVISDISQNASYTGSSIYFLNGGVANLHGTTVNGSPLGTGTGGINLPSFNIATSGGLAFFSDGTAGVDPVIERDGDGTEGYEIYASGLVRAWTTVVADCGIGSQDIPSPVSLGTVLSASMAVSRAALGGSGVNDRSRWASGTALGVQGSPTSSWRLYTPTDYRLASETITVYLIAWGRL